MRGFSFFSGWLALFFQPLEGRCHTRQDGKNPFQRVAMLDAVPQNRLKQLLCQIVPATLNADGRAEQARRL
jgi:hypothetical protein